MIAENAFPGQYPQAVMPNPKCEGCYHYDSQAGSTGACMIGLRPWLCGDGDAPEMGYAPLTRRGPMAVEASTPAPQLGTPGHATPDVPIRVVSLGDDYTKTVQMIVEERETLMRSICPMHQQAVKSNGQCSHSYEPQRCLCIPVTDIEVAKALVPLLSNSAQQRVSAQELVDFVADVRKGGETYDHTQTRFGREDRMTNIGVAAKIRDRNGGQRGANVAYDLHGPEMPPGPVTRLGVYPVRARRAKRPPLSVQKGRPVDDPVEKASTARLPDAHFKAPHGTYKITNPAPGNHVLHYTPKDGGPAQSASMPSHDHAVKIARVHAFAATHDIGGGTPTLHEGHVKLHYADNLHRESHAVTSMQQARDYLGY